MKPSRRFSLILLALAGVAATAFFIHLRRRPLQDKVYRIGWEIDPPSQVAGPREPTGLDVELVREAAKRRGIKLQWIKHPEGAAKALGSGDLDLWPLMTITEERKKRFFLSDPYQQDEIVLVTTETGISVESDDFTARTISLFDQPINFQIAHERFPQARLIPKPEARLAITAVCNGESEAALMDAFTVRSILLEGTQCPGKTLKLLPSGSSVQLGVGATREAGAAAEAIREEIGNMADEGSLTDMMRKWGHQSTSELEALRYLVNAKRRLWWYRAGITVLGLFLAFSLWLAFGYRRARNQARAMGSALSAAERNLRLVADNMDGMVLAYDMKRRLTFANTGTLDLTGYTRQELEAKGGFICWIHPGDQTRMLSSWERLFQGHACSAEYRLITKDGHEKWVFSSWGPVRDESGRQVGVYGTERDITGRKTAEERLAAIGRGVGTYVGKEFFATAVATLAGMMQAEYVWIAETLPDNRARTIAVFDQGKAAENFEYELKDTPCEDVMNKDFCVYPSGVQQQFPRDTFLADFGAEGYAGIPLFDRAGRVLGSLAYITRSPIQEIRTAKATLEIFAGRAAAELERNRSERESNQQRLRMEGIIDSSMDGIITIDEQSRIVVFNHAAEKMFQYLTEETIGEPIQRIIPAYGNVVPNEIPGSRRGRRADGEEFPMEVSISQVPLSDLKLLNVTCRDLSEQRRAEDEGKKLQAQLQQAQKMEAIGRLAGGVAHDFNNLLTVINGYADLIPDRLAPDDPVRNDIQQIHQAGDRAADLVRQLLAFSRKQVLQPQPINLSNVVAETKRMLTRVLGEHVEIVTELSPTLDPVIADPTQVGQVIMNLAVNARDAMADGGTLTLTTAMAVLGKTCGHCHGGLQPGRYARLTVRDTGVGMDKETVEQIFEPFFTTKEVGQGTGLGLSTVHGIVLQSAGHVDVETEPGRGTAFHVYLPAVAAREPVTDRLSRAPRPMGTETILLVEDQEEVRRFTAYVLASLGYRVLEAYGAEEALAHCGKQSVDMLLTDVVMPGMSGIELAARVQTLQPGVKTLFLSGYSDDMLAHHGSTLTPVNLLQKPFGRDALATRIRATLAG